METLISLNMRNDKPNIIVTKSFDLAVQISQFSDKLLEKKKYNIANQLFRSGTSIGANVREAQNAESKGDFIHKMKIAAKETEETSFWLELIGATNPDFITKEILLQTRDVQNILNKIISSSKKNVH